MSFIFTKIANYPNELKLIVKAIKENNETKNIKLHQIIDELSHPLYTGYTQYQVDKLIRLAKIKYSK